MHKEEFIKFINDLKKLNETLNSEFLNDNIYKLSLMNIFDLSKFKIGDRVQLTKTPKIDDTSGWRGSKHFLIKGAKATVSDLYFRKSSFYYLLCFDDDSYIDFNGKVCKTDRKSLFIFSENDLEEAKNDIINYENAGENI